MEEKILNQVEETLTTKFEKTLNELYDLEVFVADECSCTEDVEMMPELDAAQAMIADTIEIVKRAKQKAEGTLKGHKSARIVLSALGEYFTFDPTTPKLRYTGIPQEYRQ